MASTLCPTCGTRVEHPYNYTITVVQKDIDQVTQTKLVANDTLVTHACTTPHDPGADPPSATVDGTT